MLEEKVVLVVDDDITLLEMYVDRIKAEGAIVVEAKDGEDALQKVREDKPCVILLDIMMPKINGFDVLKQLKSDPETADVPVIILTALSDDQKRRQGLQLGADDYIVKSETLPIDVIEKIKKVISSKNIQLGV
jgi:CheY-like chemotaxis protein